MNNSKTQLRVSCAALRPALVPFAGRGINLLKTESRPIKGSPWRYRFYLDLEASTNDSKVMSALRELERCVEKLASWAAIPHALSRRRITST